MNMAVSDEIKERLDIVELVSSYVSTLRRSGHNYVAPCPFHTERTPSFVVFPERGTWRCFGACATGGDVLSFVMRMERMSFSDTLRMLAQRVGVSLGRRADDPRRSVVYRLNEAAATYFHNMLGSQQGIAARAYLRQRGIDNETGRRFRLGLSPGMGDGLREHLQSLGFTAEQAVEAGLVTGLEGAPARDLFRGRLMFPIHDAQGNIAGFGGRSLDGREPRYLNTPRTRSFDKGRILYGFHRARRAIREEGEGVVVEGYMDVIAAHQYGFENVVASMGTALTEHQVALLKGVAERFVMALDADAAGQAATFRSLRESWRALKGRPDVSLRVLVLSSGKDPDELIRNSPDEWRRSVREAPSLLDYLFGSAETFWDLSSSEGKREAAEELFPVISGMDNPFEQDVYFRRLAGTLGVSVATLEAGIGRPGAGSGPRRREKESARRASAQPFELQDRDPLEEHFLSVLLRWPELRGFVRELDAECLRQWENRELFTELLRCDTMELRSDLLDENLRQRVEYLLSLPLPPMELRQREQAVKDCFHRLEERRLRALKLEEASLLAQATDSESSADHLDEVSRRSIETNERLREIFHARSEHQRRGSGRGEGLW